MRKATLIAATIALLVSVSAQAQAVHPPADVHTCAQAGRLAELTKTLDDDASLIQARNKLGATPLHAAASGKDTAAVIELLVSRGADVNLTDTNLATPLHYAAQKLNAAAAIALLEHGAAIDAADDRGRTALHRAVEAGQPSAASGESRSTLIAALLKTGANVQATDRDGSTALHAAAARGHLHAIELLLEARADVNAADHQKRTALHWAATNADPKLAARLLDAGAKVNVADRHGYTPLHAAVKRFRADTAKALLERGAVVDARDADGATPLIALAAAEHGDRPVDAALAAVARLLLDASADVTATDRMGASALDYAQRHDYAELAAALQGR